MDKLAITSALQSTVAAVGELVRADNIYLAMAVHYADTEQEKSHPTIIELIGLLKDTPELGIFDGQMQVLWNQARRVDFEDLAAWMIRRALEIEPSQVVEDLGRFINAEQIPCYQIYALSGLRVTEPCSLGGGISLLPWEQVPDSFQKRKYYQQFIGAVPFRSPKAALVKECHIPKLYVPPADELELDQPDESDMRDALLCIGVAGPFSPELLVSWISTPGWAPVMAGGASMPFLEGHPRHDDWCQTTHHELTVKLLESFRELKEHKKDALRLPMKRLGSAIRRLSNVDSALDLGIALESIFLNDIGDDRGELSFRLRLRAARWIEDDISKREDLYQLIGDLYNLRSRAAHSGRVPDEVRGVPTTEVLKTGFEITAAAIRKIIFEGQPDWHSVTLS